MRYSWASWAVLLLAISRFPGAYLYRKWYIYLCFSHSHVCTSALKLISRSPNSPLSSSRAALNPPPVVNLKEGRCGAEQPTRFWGKTPDWWTAKRGASALKGYKCHCRCHTPKPQLHFNTKSGKRSGFSDGCYMTYCKCTLFCCSKRY